MTGVQTCALPISPVRKSEGESHARKLSNPVIFKIKLAAMKRAYVLICTAGVSAAIWSACSASAQSAYAQRNLVSDVPGPGNGYVDIYDTSGNFVKRFASNGALDSPWGMTIAPAGFGRFAGHLLIGNFGDGTIDAFDPVSGAFVGALTDTNGVPIAIEGLWGLKFGNGGKGGDMNTLRLAFADRQRIDV